MKEMTVEARGENVRVLTDWADAELEKLECPMKAQMQIDLAIDEIFTNIASYAYAPGTGNATVTMDYDAESGMFSLTFCDSGVPYNPLQKEDPDVNLPAEERSIGGLGIFLVKKTMDDMRYEYRDGQNILTLMKKIS
jgi:anti-sigma regulatory factor (Ser/Thr protein kinase)